MLINSGFFGPELFIEEWHSLEQKDDAWFHPDFLTGEEDEGKGSFLGGATFAEVTFATTQQDAEAAAGVTTLAWFTRWTDKTGPKKVLEEVSSRLFGPQVKVTLAQTREDSYKNRKSRDDITAFVYKPEFKASAVYSREDFYKAKKPQVDITTFVYNPPAVITIDGMSWFERWSSDPVTKPVYTIPTAHDPQFIPGVTISGMSWFERWSIDPVTKPRFTDPFAAALTPDTLPPRIAGISWFERWGVDPVTKPTLTTPYQLGLVPIVLQGMPWFERWSIDPTTKPVFTQPRAGVITESLIPAIIEGIAWFERWTTDPVTKPTFTQPRAGTITEILIPSGVEGISWFERWSIDPVKKPTFTNPSAIIGLRAEETTDKIEGMAWFEPWDRDKKATKIRLESLPGHVLTDTRYYLPVVGISGMAWFNPDQPVTIKRHRSINDLSNPAVTYLIFFQPHEIEEGRVFNFERRNVRSQRLPLRMILRR